MKKVFKYFLWIVLVGIVAFTFVYLYNKSRPKEKRYNIEQAAIGTVEKHTVATGKVEPRNEILIKPQMSGIISEVYKEAGEKVKTGDILAKIKVIPDMVSLNSAESRLTRAQLAFEQSERNFQREKRLYEDNVISKEDFEKTQLIFSNDREELKTAQENLNLVRDGVSSSTTTATNTLVRSTIDGTILDVPVKVGNSVIQSNTFNDGTTIASVANMNDMLFVGKMDETEVGRIHVGMPMDITIGALQDMKFRAVLEYISPKGAEENGAIMFQMKAAIEIPDTMSIRAGYSANADILLAQAADVLTIPESCITFLNDTSFVYKLITEEPQEFEKHPVVLGMSDGIKIEVKEGLSEGERIRGLEIIEPKK